MNEDMSAFLGVFLEEAGEQITLLEQAVLKLEQPASPALLQEIFRAAHTLKGSALAMGFDSMGALTHALEDVFEGLRSSTLAVSRDLTDALLAALDALNAMQADIAAGGSSPREGGLETTRLRALLAEEQAGQGENAAHSAGAQFIAPASNNTASVTDNIAPKQAARSEQAIITANHASLVREQPQGQIENRKSKIENPFPPSATVRVDVERLDTLLDLVGELVIDRARLADIGQQWEREHAASGLSNDLQETARHVGRLTASLQDEIMRARTLPLENVFNRFPRMVRDLAQKLGKDENFVVTGQDTELDRSMLEAMGDPLIHMLRNSVDHGIEMPDAREQAGKPRAGTVWLRARHQANHIVVEIQDDGKGMDPAKLRASAIEKNLLTSAEAARLTDAEAMQLIFAPGFSTAQTLTDISGRGVGMDIVKSNLHKLGARIEIASTVGAGTTFTIFLPLTLAILRCLLVRVADAVYALPLHGVEETLKMDARSVHVVNGREILWQRNCDLPLIRLDLVLGIGYWVLGNADTKKKAVRTGRENHEECSSTLNTGRPLVDKYSIPNTKYIVIAGAGATQAGFVVDALLGEQEVVVKSLGAFIGDIEGITGAAILGDGRIALIADMNCLLELAAGEKEEAYAA